MKKYKFKLYLLIYTREYVKGDENGGKMDM